MIYFYLSASIITSTFIFVVFKLFDRKGVDNLTAIVINYGVAATLGFCLNTEYAWDALHHQSWFSNALVLGFIFITIFNVMAKTSQIHGVSVASVATKMSVVIPVVAAFFLYNDEITAMKIVGLVLALAGVYLVSKPKVKTNMRMRYLFLPILVFAGSGFIDTFIKYNQEVHFEDSRMEAFLILTFLVAGLAGITYCLVTNKGKWNRKNLLWGIGLGVPNYFSMYFLVKTLDAGWESSVIFPVNNLGIVALSALVSLIGFRESLSRLNWIGIGLSMLAIIIFALPNS